MKKIIFASVVGILLAACNAPAPTATPALPTPTVPFMATIASPTGYRPLQIGDELEGTTISYQYVLPSLDKPTATVAFGTFLLELVSVKPEMTDGLLAYLREVVSSPAPVYAYDEATPNQTEPKPVTFDASKPVELVFIQLVDGPHYWSVTETNEDGVQAAYKIVRRKDGGLRFIDVYGQVALHSAAGTVTLNGGGLGLFLSARLALLKLITKDARYQRGADVFSKYPVDANAYDKRILVLDPSRDGPAKNRDWVLVSRPGPDTGLQ